MGKLIVLTFLSLSITVGIGVFHWKSSHSSAVNTHVPMTKTPPEHRRTPDQTFLTYPEWFLVYSPDEFATLTKNRPAHEFPFFGHLRQFWQAYGAVNKYISGRFPFNFGYHVMVIVIGGSTTLEYVLRSCYENVIGRLSYLTTGSTFSDEDRYAAVVAREYVDFIKIQPWYEFDFAGRLKDLWRKNPVTGNNMIRKWERRYALTTEYTAKAIYGWLIKKATKASYDQPIPTTAVVIDKPLASSYFNSFVTALPQASDSTLILLPRYDGFKDQAARIAREGYNFLEIAGNQGSIFVTYLVPEEWVNPENGTTILFTQPILTNRKVKRIALIIPVNKLADLLRSTSVPEVQLEHIYDF